MTKFLLKVFMKNLDPDHERSSLGQRSGVVGIVCNILLFLAKLLAGLLAGSVSIMADAMNNLTDATSSVVTLLGFKMSEKPADADHPYGHARFEYLAGLAVAALIIVIGVELGKSSFDKILHPASVSFSWLSVAILVVSIAVKMGMWWMNTVLSRQIQSTALAATAQDSRNDAIATGAVLIAGVIEYATGATIDGWMGMAVALFILYSGVMAAKETISPLLGESASPELRELIVDYVRSQPKVLGFHDLMVHDYGPGQRFATLHVEMDNREDPLTCHELIDDMERECHQNHGIHLVIHYDPVVTDDPEMNRLRAACEELLTKLDPRLHLHDFRMVLGESHTNLIFDVALPQDMAGRESEITAHLEGNLSRQEGKRIYTVITFDPEAFNVLIEGLKRSKTMKNYFDLHFDMKEINAISNLGLAHIGDGVYELMCRSYLCCKGDKTVKNLHKDSVAMVKAPTQAKYAEKLLPHLTEQERDWFRRGKNAHSHAAPKSATPQEYAKATGLETLFGALYLSGQTQRLNELFDIMVKE